MSWYKWITVADFDAWHDEVKTALNYPIAAVNIEGEPTDAQATTDYTAIIEVSDQDYRAWVDDEIAIISDKIGIQSEQPIFERFET